MFGEVWSEILKIQKEKSKFYSFSENYPCLFVDEQG
jgi:hypothetical protein